MIYFALAREQRIVKIGYSTNVAARLQALPSEYGFSRVEIIALMPGTFGDEADLHKRFARWRTGQGTECFHAAREILAFAKALPRVVLPGNQPLVATRMWDRWRFRERARKSA